LGSRRWPPPPKNMVDNYPALAGFSSPPTREEDADRFLHSLVRFVHSLRRLGIRVSVAETRDALDALSRVNLLDRGQVKVALSATLVKNYHNRKIFDQAFDSFFAPSETLPQKQPELMNEQPVCGGGRDENVGDRLVKAVKEDERDWGKEFLNLLYLTVEENEKMSIKPGWTKQFKKQFIETIGKMQGGGDEGPSAPVAGKTESSLKRWRRQMMKQAIKAGWVSPAKNLIAGSERLDGVPETVIPDVETRQDGESVLYEDMKKIAEEDLARAGILIKKLSRRLATRISRRYFKGRRRGRLDIRRTIRRNVSYGGTLMDLKFQSRKEQKPRLVLICDVSGSMARYTVFVIQFIYGLSNVVRGIETFIFSEELERVTPYMKKGDGFARTMSSLVEKSSQWGMGTNLHASLAAFLKDYLRLLSPSTYVIIVSDGQTIQADQAARNLEEIRSRVRDIIWLNTMPREGWKRSPAINEFQKHCQMFECSTLDQLNRVLGSQMLNV